MNKKVLSVLGIILAAVVGGGIYLLVSGTNGDSKDSIVGNTQAEAAVSIPDSSPEDTPGAYVDYSEQALAAAQGTRLLFFYSSTSSSSQKIDDDIRVHGAPKGVTIIKVDYDSAKGLSDKYHVTEAASVVRIDNSGNLIERYAAGSEPSLGSIQANLL